MTPFWEGFKAGLALFGLGLVSLFFGAVIWALMAVFIGEGWALALLIAGLVGSVLTGVWHASGAYDALDDDADREFDDFWSER